MNIKKSPDFSRDFVGAPSRTRTGDTLIKSQVLYLSCTHTVYNNNYNERFDTMEY